LRQAGPITVRVAAGDEVRDNIYTISMPDRIELGYEASIILKGVVASLARAWRADWPNLDRLVLTGGKPLFRRRLGGIEIDAWETPSQVPFHRSEMLDIVFERPQPCFTDANLIVRFLQEFRPWVRLAVDVLDLVTADNCGDGDDVFQPTLQAVMLVFCAAQAGVDGRRNGKNQPFIGDAIAFRRACPECLGRGAKDALQHGGISLWLR
jgi:hypothetical protein